MVATIVNILIQCAIIFALVIYFDGIFVFYYAGCFLLSVVLCIYVLNKDINSGYKIAWILLLMLLPMFGVTLYVMLDSEWLTRKTKNKMQNITNRIKDELIADEELTFNDEFAKRQSNYISKFSYSPPVKNTKSKYFTSGEEFFESLLVDLGKAEKSIFMEYFIIKESYMWDKLKKILIDKVSEGVDVRIIYDDLGSIDRLRRREIKDLISKGIKIKTFNPFVPIMSKLLNNRDHRKICTIDTKIAYCGGVNIADEYINRDSKFGHWKDSGVAMYGEASFNFEVFFLTLWEYITGEKQTIKKPQYRQCDYGIFQPYTDSPIDKEQVGENIYMNIISQAQRYVYISTPYFIVDDEMLKLITNVAKSGVDVRIVVPHIPDKKAVNQITKSYYKRLITSGVKVYEYKKGFNHSKIVVADDKIATVGSVNFDYRSFFLSFECGVWMYNTDTVNDVLFDFNSMLTECIKISLEDCKVSIFTRMYRAILNAFSPLF